MRVSKDTASRMARQLTKKSYDKWKAAEAAVPKFIIDLHDKKTPDDVKAFTKDHPGYISTSSTIYLEGPGMGHNAYENIGKNLPRNSGGGSTVRMVLTTKEAEALKKLQHARTDAKKKWEDLLQETTNSIMALGSSKRVAEHFPQAANLIPDTPAKTMALIPNLEGLTNKLKNQ